MRRKVNFLLSVLLVVTGIYAYAQTQESGQVSLFPDLDTTASRQLLRRARDIALEHPDSAAAICRDVLQQSLESGYAPGIISAHIGLGVLATQQGKYYQSLMHYHRASGYCDTGEYARYYANIYSNIGSVYTYLDRYEDAARAFYRAVFYMEKYPGGLSAGYVYNNLGMLLADRGQYEQALIYLNKALHDELPDPRKSAIMRSAALLNISNIYFKDDQVDRAFYYIDSAIRIQRRVGAYDGLSKSLVNLGLLYMKKGRTDTALSVLQEAENLAAQYQINPYHYNAAIRTIGMVYIARKDFRAAEKYLVQAWESGAMIPREKQIVMERL